MPHCFNLDAGNRASAVAAPAEAATALPRTPPLLSSRGLPLLSFPHGRFAPSVGRTRGGSDSTEEMTGKDIDTLRAKQHGTIQESLVLCISISEVLVIASTESLISPLYYPDILRMVHSSRHGVALHARGSF